MKSNLLFCLALATNAVFSPVTYSQNLNPPKSCQEFINPNSETIFPFLSKLPKDAEINVIYEIKKTSKNFEQFKTCLTNLLGFNISKKIISSTPLIGYGTSIRISPNCREEIINPNSYKNEIPNSILLIEPYELKGLDKKICFAILYFLKDK